MVALVAEVPVIEVTVWEVVVSVCELDVWVSVVAVFETVAVVFVVEVMVEPVPVDEVTSGKKNANVAVEVVSVVSVVLVVVDVVGVVVTVLVAVDVAVVVAMYPPPQPQHAVYAVTPSLFGKSSTLMLPCFACSTDHPGPSPPLRAQSGNPSDSGVPSV